MYITLLWIDLVFVKEGATLQSIWEQTVATLLAALVGWACYRLTSGRSRLERLGVASGVVVSVGLVLVGIHVWRSRPVLTVQPTPSDTGSAAATHTGREASRVGEKDPPISQPAQAIVNPPRTVPPEVVAAAVPSLINAAALEAGEPLVLIVDDTRHQPEIVVTTALAREVKGNAGAFRPAFVTGVFMRAYEGDSRELAAIPRIQQVPLIVLGVVNARYTSNDDISSGLMQADLHVDARVYRPQHRFATQLLQAQATGAGFSKAAALERAGAEVATKVTDSLK